MIDLHLHTTASDGRSTPEDLVREASAAGITVMAVTDHDTTAGVHRAQAAAREGGLVCLSGIEISAVHEGRDVHLLGYFLDPDEPALADFLAAQRAERRRRLVEILERLRGLGLPIDEAPLMAATLDGARSVGRPLVAAALVAAGCATDVTDAFDRYLGAGRPAFVARRGASPGQVIGRLHEAGAIVSLAHPGKQHLEALVPDLVAVGLDAVEAYHPDHDADLVARYLAIARTFNLAVSGGSDYHGPGSGRADALGRVGLPAEAFDDLASRIEPGA